MTADSDPTSLPKPEPPPVPVGYGYAGPWIRFVALTFDGVLLAALFVSAAVVLDIAAPLAAESGPEFVNFAPSGWAARAVFYVVSSIVLLGWYGGWQAGVGGTPGMLLLKLRVRGPNRQDNPSFVAAVIRNSPVVLGNFNGLPEDDGIGVLVGIVSIAISMAIGVSISNSHTRQGFHDRLAGGTYVLRRQRRRHDHPEPLASQM